MLTRHHGFLSNGDIDYKPVMRAFQEFFSRAQRFNPLTLGDDIFGNNPVMMEKKTSGKKNIILMEDLPPVSASSSLKIFQDTIFNFANTRSSTASVLVIIVSDAFSKQNTELVFSSNDNRDQAYSYRTLLPKTLLDRLDSGAGTSGRIKQIKYDPEMYSHCIAGITGAELTLCLQIQSDSQNIYDQGDQSNRGRGIYWQETLHSNTRRDTRFDPNSRWRYSSSDQLASVSVLFASGFQGEIQSCGDGTGRRQIC